MMPALRDERPSEVLGLYHSYEATAYYRLYAPYATAVGASVQHWGDETAAQHDAARVVVLARIVAQDRHTEREAIGLISQIQDGGRRRVYMDMDDDALSVSPSRPGVDPISPQGRRNWLAMLVNADGITTTNTTLAARLRRYHRNVIVIPNYVRPDEWPAPAVPAGGPTVILLTGSMSHYDDWRQVVPALTDIRRRYGREVVIRVAGALPDYLRPLCDEHRGWAERMADYPAQIAGAHIALCPLLDTSFNRCKSPIKLFETALSGAAVIGSSTQYGPILRAAGLGHAVISAPAQWRDAIDAYLRHPERRIIDAATLRAHVVARYDARTHAAATRAALAI